MCKTASHIIALANPRVHSVSVVMVSRLALNMRHPSIMQHVNADSSVEDLERANAAWISSIVDVGMTTPSEVHALEPRRRVGDLGQGRNDGMGGPYIHSPC